MVVLLAAPYVAARLLTSQHAWARAVSWGESDVEDQFRFPARTVPAGDQVSPLPTGPAPAALTWPLPDDEGHGQSWDEFLEATGTRAFLVVHRDRLVHERYFDGADREDRQTSFSMAKSVLSTLVGIAVDEGLVEDVTDPVTAYLPELAERDERFGDITLQHLLTMSSGIAYDEAGLPWSDDALTYYGTDLRELALEATEVEDEPGEWHYNNFHPLLLGLVLERVTGTTVSDYLSTRLWQPLGAEADATWSLDSEDSGFEKLESGVNARPVDFARLGLMMLHEGRWNGRQIVSRAWVREATSPSVETDEAAFYQYLWWVGAADAGTAPYFARGKYGQVIGVFPEQDVVIVRLGTTDAGIDWPARLQALALQVAAG